MSFCEIYSVKNIRNGSEKIRMKCQRIAIKVFFQKGNDKEYEAAADCNDANP